MPTMITTASTIDSSLCWRPTNHTARRLIVRQPRNSARQSAHPICGIGQSSGTTTTTPTSTTRATTTSTSSTNHTKNRKRFYIINTIHHCQHLHHYSFNKLFSCTSLTTHSLPSNCQKPPRPLASYGPLSTRLAIPQLLLCLNKSAHDSSNKL